MKNKINTQEFNKILSFFTSLLFVLSFFKSTLVKWYFEINFIIILIIKTRGLEILDSVENLLWVMSRKLIQIKSIAPWVNSRIYYML